MLRKLTLTALLAFLLLALSGQTASAYRPTVKFQPGCLEVRKGINFYRGMTWHWQDELGFQRARSLFITKEKPASCKYAYWVAERWMLRATYFHERYKTLYQAETPEQIKNVIREVFKGYANQAISVAWCESRYSLWADNGQYENIFQMGTTERETYGWHTKGSPAIVAARAAWNYFNASGRDWSPWQCKP